MKALTETAPNSNAIKGAAASLSVVLIWATWLVSTRYSGGGTLTTLDLSLLRYAIPAIILLPALRRVGIWPRQVPKVPLLLMIVGSGAPFFQVAAFGMHGTPASAAGVLLPGFMPLATAIIGIAFMGERPDAMRVLGMVAIFAGGLLLLFGGESGASLGWRSYAILPAAATLWAIYTHAFRRTGLGAFEAGALICFWSTVLNLLFLPFVGSHFLTAPPSEILLQAIPQGLLSGLLATLLFGTGVRLLGATQAAAYTAITPIAAVMGGAMLLGERIDGVMIAAAIMTGVGVLFSTGLLSRRKAK